jgi:predicted permease
MFWAASTWRSFDVALNWRGLLLTAALSVLAGAICGLAPLVRARQVALAPALSVRGDGGAASRLLASRLLVIAQIALALVIVAAASLLARSLGSLREQPLGFDRENLVLVWTQPSSTGKQGQALRDLWRDATARIASLPGVASAGSWNSQLLNGGLVTPGPEVQHIHVDGRPARKSPLPYGRTFVTPGIFKALGVPLLAGREFTDRDTETSPAVGIINETMARVYFERENPVGRHVRFGSPAAPLVEIVGVVRDYEGGTPRGIGQPRLQTFFPYRASDGGQLVVMCVAIRTQGDPTPVMARVRDMLNSVDPSLSVLKINTVAQQLDDLLAQDRLLATLVGLFAGVAGGLACLGLYGLVAHMTARRTTEIGVRMALGATASSVSSMVLRDGAKLALCGLLVGVPAALLAGRLMASQLFHVGPYDPLTMGFASAVMLAVTVVAAWLPARRAARVNPIVALREG